MRRKIAVSWIALVAALTLTGSAFASPNAVIQGYEHGELALDRNVSLAEAIAFIARAKGVAVDRNMAKNTVQPMVPSNPESAAGELVPARETAKLLGIKISYSLSTKTVTLMQGSSKVEYALNSDMAVINGTNSTVKAALKNNKLWLPSSIFQVFSPPVQSAEQAGPKVKSTPKNVIVMVGDGMGIGQIEVARLLEYGKEGRLFIESLPNVALLHTYSANNIVTDSAAAGTALATGVKTNNEMIGMKPDGTPVDSVLDVFKKSGKKVGIISTNTVTDATPAAYSASASDRAGQEDIARQILDSEIDVILGGGAKYFSPDKQEGVNLVNKFKEKGYSYVTNKAELASNKSDKLLGLFHDSYMNYKSDRDDLKSQEPTLTEMTMTAIKALSKEQEGFFLMSEGARIDHASHAADITSVWKETIEFDNAVKAAVEWARKDGETLVLVLADHETMGISATEPMDIDGLKKIQVSAEFMAAQLKMDKATGASTPSSVKEVFKKYANISLTDEEVASFNQHIKDKEGKAYPQHKVAWEIGSMIAQRNHVGVVSREVRRLSDTGGHTGNMVPVFAFGPGADKFEGVLDNIDIPRLILEVSNMG